MRRWLVLILVCAGTIAVADVPVAPSSTGRHLLAGARAFQQGQYEEALVELRVVARARDAPADLAFYLGPTLYKLGRHREALSVFLGSRAPADALTRFYLGETYYALGLHRSARAEFASLRSAGLGPALDDAAGRYVAVVDAAYVHAPEPSVIDGYLDQGKALGALDPEVGAAFLEEARLVEAISAPHRHDEIAGELGRTWNTARRPRAVIEALASDARRGAEGTWQLARAYAAVDDRDHALVVIDALIQIGGAHAADAAALRAKLAP